MDHKKRFSLTPQQKQLILRIAIVLAFGVLAFTVYKCPIKLLFGIDCPGCGMTRAFKAALCFRFREAFQYHPLFWLAMPVTGYGIVSFLFPDRSFLPKRVEFIVYTVSAALLIIVWLIRMFV